MKITLDLDLLAKATGLVVQPHKSNPAQWVAGLDGKGDTDTHDSAESALVAAVAWLVGLVKDAQAQQAQDLADLAAAMGLSIADANHDAAATTMLVSEAFSRGRVHGLTQARELVLIVAKGLNE